MSILQKYGIKEVADVTFYSIDDTGRPVSPVLFLDTLKVSTIEQTAEEAEARGGKGNGLLILWDYGKDINVSLEDALFSAKSLAIMFGGGEIKRNGSFTPEGLAVYLQTSQPELKQGNQHLCDFYAINLDFDWGPIDDQQLIVEVWEETDEETWTKIGTESLIHGWYGPNKQEVWYGQNLYPLQFYYIPYSGLWFAPEGYLMKSEFFCATKDVTSFVEPYDWGWSPNFSQNGKSYTKVNPLFFDTKGVRVTSLEEGKEYFCTYDLAMSSAQVIEISAKTFPGIYYITGTTYCRNQDSGKDEMFEFIIPKAKVQSENTITLEAEGDPSVFNMNLRVLRNKNGGMMKLVKYELDGGDETEELKSELIHNHQLEGENVPPPPPPILNIDYQNMTAGWIEPHFVYGDFLVDSEWTRVRILEEEEENYVWISNLPIPNNATKFRIQKQSYGSDDSGRTYEIILSATDIESGSTVIPQEVVKELDP